MNSIPLVLLSLCLESCLSTIQSQRPQDNGNLSPSRSNPNHQPLPYSLGKTQAQAVIPRIPSGSTQGDFLVHDPKQFAKATDSTALQSFVFLGNRPQDQDTTKCKYCRIQKHSARSDMRILVATIPRYLPRKSRNELRRLNGKCLCRAFFDVEFQGLHTNADSTHLANGEASWADGRRPPFKKLKVTVPKTHRPRGLEYSGTSRASDGAREDSSSEPSSDSEPEDDSDYESDSEEELHVEETSPLPATRPADPSKGTVYDIIKAVWAPRTSAPTPATIRTALGDYWNAVRAVRDVWKADTAALQNAEDDKQMAKVPELKNKVLEQRKLMEVILVKTLEHGHHDIIEKYVNFSFPFLSFAHSSYRSKPQQKRVIGDCLGTSMQRQLLSCLILAW